MKKVGPIEIKFNGNESNWIKKALEKLQESSETISKIQVNPKRLAPYKEDEDIVRSLI